MQNLTICLLLTKPFFGQVLPDRLADASFVLGIFLTLIWFIANQGWSKLGVGWPGTLWLGFALMVGVSHLWLAPKFQVTALILVVAVIVMLLSSISTAWVSSAFNVLLLFALVHAAATVFFYLFPAAYAGLVKARFFPNDYGATGYMSALTSHYSYNAMYCTLGFVVTSNRALFSRGSNRITRLNWVLTAMFLFALVLTTKRGHLVFSVVAVLLVYLLSNARGKVLKSVAVGGVALTTIAWLSTFVTGVAESLERLIGTLGSDDIGSVTSGRNLLWEFAIEEWRQNPILGNGWQSFHFIWPGGARESFHAHNQLMNTLFEAGIIGAAILLLTTASTLFLAVKTMKQSNDAKLELQGAPASTALSLQLFLLLYGFTSGELFNAPYTFLPYLLAVSATLAYSRFLKLRSSQSEECRAFIR